ncbi:MAG TPA: S-layer homology domain-containing protein, partial [Oscillospiraceae bacterium]|nr:S-layer homology domain-containing protein [Oscillospiraceae bacterium]
LTAGDTQITDFGGTATVSIPYTLQSGEDPNAVVVYYIDDSGALNTVRGRYDSETGTVRFTTTHFSVYAVGYSKVAFDDVAAEAWYHDAVGFCAARGITAGTGGGRFSPDAALTRGEFIVMLMRAYGIGADEDPADNFSDAGDTYYTGYLAAAKRLEISNGVGNNLFAPEQEITRQDMFTLLYRALNVLGELPEADGSAALTDFGDAGMISDYAEAAMETLVAAGIVSGSGGKLDPLGGSTRSQMAQVLYNLLSR